MKRFVFNLTWGVSRGRDTYGYSVVSLRESGTLIARCNGGGYDMRGTVLGNAVAHFFRGELLALKEADMPEGFDWVRDPGYLCREKCLEEAEKAAVDAIAEGKDIPRRPVYLVEWGTPCPVCGEPLTGQNREGKRVSRGRSLYGLTYHDPNYDPGKAVIGEGCDDRTLGKEGESVGKTVEEREAAGVSFGLERYQAVYRASSKFPTERHTVPSIDGACGLEQVRKIVEAIGWELVQIVDKKTFEAWEVVKLSEVEKLRRKVRRCHVCYGTGFEGDREDGKQCGECREDQERIRELDAAAVGA